MERKYKLLEEDSITFMGETLYRIQALYSFGNVKEGDLGGYIQIEANLSHCGEAWVFDESKVLNDARVYDNALVYGSALVYGEALIYDNARVFENAEIFGSSEIYGHAKVFGNSRIYDKAKVHENAQTYGNTWLSSTVDAKGDVRIANNTICYKRLFGGIE